jgi:conjugal transfer pilus assembly protein TraF
MKRWYWSVVWIFGLSVAHANSVFVLHQQGWHWYETREETRVDEGNAAIVHDPKAVLHQVTEQVEQLRAQAILQPTVENVAKYIAVQNQVTANAALFSKVWQTVLWQKPWLNYRLTRPTDQVGQAIWQQTQAKARDALLHNAAKTLGLVFVFSDTCPYCQRFAPTLKAVTTRYPFSVLPVSVTGKGLPAYPHPVVDEGFSTALGVQQVPALFLVEPTQNQVYLVSLGLQSEKNIIARLAEVVKSIEQAKGEKDAT